MWRYLQRWAYRILNDLAVAGYDPPCSDVLSDLFFERLESHAALWDPYEGRGPGLSADTAALMAETAAEAALRDWSPEYIRQQAERGRIGGSRSRRGPTKATGDNGAKLAALPEGLTVAQQADRLGLSAATVKRLRSAGHDLHAVPGDLDEDTL